MRLSKWHFTSSSSQGMSAEQFSLLWPSKSIFQSAISQFLLIKFSLLKKIAHLLSFLLFSLAARNNKKVLCKNERENDEEEEEKGSQNDETFSFHDIAKAAAEKEKLFEDGVVEEAREREMWMA